MRRRKPYMTTLDRVQIRREGDCAIIEYADEDVGGVQLQIGPQVDQMSEKEILQMHNDMLRAQEELARNYEHIAIEIPEGSAQIKYDQRSHQWIPQGGVIRCMVTDGEDGEVAFYVDDKELSLEEFGRMLHVYNGWGMRIEFTPDDETHERPKLEVHSPKDEK